MQPRRSQIPPPPPPRSGAPRQYALRFISGKYQGGELKLPQNREVVVGRSSELDVVLVEDMVSRRHAKITVAGDQIFIQDLGSTNGTFVNGEKVKRVRLHEGDRVLIGTSIIKVVGSEGEAPPEDLMRARADLEAAAQGQRAQGPRSMSGLLEEVPLVDLLQLFATSKKSGVLSIRSVPDSGRVYLDKGRIIFAVVNDNTEVPPLKSIIRILRWEKGTFEMEPPEEREFPETIQTTTEGVLMEAMRQMDEVKRLEAELPARDAGITVSTPLIAQLRDLEQDELDVFQAVLNTRTVEQAMNKSPLTDLDTSVHLLKLLKDGYVRIV